MKKNYKIIYRNRTERLVFRILRKPINAFAKRVVNRAKEMGIVNSHTQHELYGIIDRSLWPERYVNGASPDGAAHPTAPKQEG